MFTHWMHTKLVYRVYINIEGICFKIKMYQKYLNRKSLLSRHIQLRFIHHLTNHHDNKHMSALYTHAESCCFVNNMKSNVKMELFIKIDFWNINNRKTFDFSRLMKTKIKFCNNRIQSKIKMKNNYNFDHC